MRTQARQFFSGAALITAVVIGLSAPFPDRGAIAGDLYDRDAETAKYKSETNTGGTYKNPGNSTNTGAPVKPKPQPVTLAANDISILFPAPQSGSDLKNTISMGELGQAWSNSAFRQLIALASSPLGSVVSGDNIRQISFQDEFKNNKARWHITGIRIDPSAPGVSGAIRRQFGTSPQIRLILSPVTGQGDALEVHDFAIHLIYTYTTGVDAALQPGCLPRARPDQTAFKAIIADFAGIKTDLAGGGLGGKKVLTDGANLRVHPGLADAATATAVKNRIRSVLQRHLPKGRLSAMAVMGVPGANEPWIFLALQLGKDGKYNPVPSPSAVHADVQLLQKVLAGQEKNPGEVGKVLFSQMLSFLDDDRILPKPANNNMGPITCQFFFRPEAARKGVSTRELFTDNNRSRVRRVVDVIADPTQSHFFNTDCVSCHTETHREIELLNATSIEGVDSSILPKSDWNVRNFGWFRSRFVGGKAVATATRRTATETAEVLECINHIDACFARVQ